MKICSRQAPKTKLNISRECPTSTDTGCFADVTYKYLDNTDSRNYTTVSWLADARFLLTDGMAISFDWSGGHSTGEASKLFTIRVDVNGIKPPNQWEKDLFYFYYDSDLGGLKPYGDGSNCTTSGTGEMCAVKVLQESAITYY